MDRGAIDHVAEVVGAGDGRYDDDQAHRGALVGARQVHPSGSEERMGAGSLAGARRPDLTGGRTRGRGLLTAPRTGWGGDRGERSLRAVGDAAERSEEPGRCRDVDRGEVLIAVVAVHGEDERRVAPG